MYGACGDMPKDLVSLDVGTSGFCLGPLTALV